MDRAFRQLLDRSPQIAVGVLSALAERLAPTTLERVVKSGCCAASSTSPTIREIAADQARAHELNGALQRHPPRGAGRARPHSSASCSARSVTASWSSRRFAATTARTSRSAAGTFVNFDCVHARLAPISIGAACQLATARAAPDGDAPDRPRAAARGRESAKPITIGDNVWLGGGVIVCPGVTIGDDTVVGAGAVVNTTCRPAWSRSATPRGCSGRSASRTRSTSPSSDPPKLTRLKLGGCRSTNGESRSSAPARSARR